MTEEDLQTARRFAEALPAEPFGGPILRVIAEVEQRRGQVLELARQVKAWSGKSAAQDAELRRLRDLLGEAS